MNLLILVVDDEPDVEVLFRQQFRRDLRIDLVSSNSATAGPGSSTTSTIVVSTTGVIGGFGGLAFFLATFFARGLLALATPFFGRNLVAVRPSRLTANGLGGLARPAARC